MLASLVAFFITSGARLLTGARALWLGSSPLPVQRIYYANHSSHGDFVLLWASLPPELRQRTRPVAGSDYWMKGALRSFLIQRVFNGVLVDRQRSSGSESNPLQAMLDALEQGDSLIVFPEGTRNLEDGLLPFKSGLYHLAKARPDVEVVPVWIANLNRVMPKGRALPLPLLCTLNFGAPLGMGEEEGKEAFLERARDTLLAMGPEEV
ncbi:MAG: lysophospholipid acyltransferase family protein [Pseudomonas sp.]|uniref:lysophospholipid acyltransferase family protein n=1 Tax=Pseudomonas sp. TaxID=306 RepID=UPI003D121748